MNTVVVKFGGSSQSQEGYNVIIRRVEELVNDFDRVIVVISAIRKTTNALYSILEGNKIDWTEIIEWHCVGLNQEQTTKMLLKIDQVRTMENSDLSDPYNRALFVGQGERLAVFKFCILVQKAVYLHAERIIHSIDDKINNVSLTSKNGFVCDSTEIPEIGLIVTEGFLASTLSDRRSILLGRSGSDTTASLIAGAVNANHLEIWTDVNGIYTADPRIVPNARIIPKIGYIFCQELTAMGSKVIHPYALRPCQLAGVPIHINNIFNPDSIGTVINETNSSPYDVVISLQKGITVITMESPKI